MGKISRVNQRKQTQKKREGVMGIRRKTVNDVIKDNIGTSGNTSGYQLGYEVKKNRNLTFFLCYFNKSTGRYIWSIINMYKSLKR